MNIKGMLGLKKKRKSVSQGGSPPETCTELGNQKQTSSAHNTASRKTSSPVTRLAAEPTEIRRALSDNITGRRWDKGTGTGTHTRQTVTPPPRERYLAWCVRSEIMVQGALMVGGSTVDFEPTNENQADAKTAIPLALAESVYLSNPEDTAGHPPVETPSLCLHMAVRNSRQGEPIRYHYDLPIPMAEGAFTSILSSLDNRSKSPLPAGALNPPTPKEPIKITQGVPLGHIEDDSTFSRDPAFVEHCPAMRHQSALITIEDMKKIRRHLPLKLRDADWTLLYSTASHGFSLHTLYRRTARKGPCVLVCKDDQGYIFGAHLTEEPRMSESKFYGGGNSFLFNVTPHARTYSWAYGDEFFILGDPDGLTIGGGGGKGLFLDGDLFHGMSQACDTFESAPLASSELFKCVSVEVWGFVSL